MDTIALNSDWDLYADANGNIAKLTGDDALAQDVASACRLFKGELFYDTTQGVPYWQSILGQLPPLQFLKNAYATAALTVPGIVAAVCFIQSLANRSLAGQVQATNEAGTVLPIGF